MRSATIQTLEQSNILREQSKKVYNAPRLTVHGTVEQITHNVGTGAYDFPDGSQIQA
jgi:hypothetical protein